MGDEVKNLWGILPDIKKLIPPHEVILAQNRFLLKMTGNRVCLSVEKQQSKSVIFRYEIYLDSASISHREKIFSLTYDHKLFPANIYEEREGLEYKSANSHEFETNLGIILSSDELMNRIGTLVAQCQLAEELSNSS